MGGGAAQITTGFPLASPKRPLVFLAVRHPVLHLSMKDSLSRRAGPTRLRHITPKATAASRMRRLMHSLPPLVRHRRQTP